MPKAEDGKKSTENQAENAQGSAEPEKKVSASPLDKKEEKPSGLSLRDALEVGITANKTDAELAAEGKAKKPGTKAEPDASNVTDELPPLTPPAEYNAEEKADFLTLSRKGQEAQLRLHTSRLKKAAELGQQAEALKREREEIAPYKEISNAMIPFLKALGTDMSSPVAIQKALASWDKFEKDAGPEAAAEYLEAKGHKELAADIRKKAKVESKPQDITPQITPIEKRLHALESQIAERDNAQVRQLINSEWKTFTEEKNAAGKAKFPDLVGDNDQVRQLESRVGSLVLGNTEVSKSFIESCKARIPGLTFQRLLLEAYRFHGGRVDESAEAPRNSNVQNSRRANAIQPGRGAQNGSGTPPKKYATFREAAAAAIDQLNDGE